MTYLKNIVTTTDPKTIIDTMDPKIKLLRFTDRVQGVMEGKFEPPIMADIDIVTGVCNIDCEWCCQMDSRKSKNALFMDEETMIRMGEFCKDWGIKSWRIAGDSEPTLNKSLGTLLQSGYDNNLDMGLITNGILLNKVKNLEYLTWISVSLDASTPEIWSKLKHSPEKNFHKIIDNVKYIKKTKKYKDVDITLKFTKWSSENSIGRKDFIGIGKTMIGDNYKDSELLPELAEELGVKYRIHEAFPKEPDYQFDTCRATPLYATFGADHKYYLCCDRRLDYILTDDYTKDDWKELPRLWGSQEHKDLIDSIVPKSCLYCSKHWLNAVMENVIGDGKHTDDYQVNFI